ncbi:hypothetical protein AXE80_13625 [Wenyingzhuangia fucanilytica]|uniref:Uncharacterized protein n=1 Tax=Wenyingzhuangia fucanilytica TaxID=1790137 RepID=A0A1B1Y918_9FLAO|nr:T9SS type A sorting domain-containing protein [Wenyingzhuangia fucanilytica]ANW97267.1 hypothetical protein AXE80_13625 [Wenyingzhuangia fucanilytica]
MNKKTLFYLFTVFSVLYVQAQTIIDFDAVRDLTKPLNTEIQKLINSNPGAIIEFKSSEYDLEKRGLTISKPITLRGLTNNSLTPDLSGKGADNKNILSEFVNCNTILIRSDNVHIESLYFKKDYGPKYNVFFNFLHPTYLDQDLDTNLEYTGISLKNVVIDGGGYAVTTGNGFGGTFENVSVINFNVIGVWFNRRGNVKKHSKVTFTNCTFEPRNDLNSNGAPVFPGSNIEFNDRAISFDGGNTSYPIVWDHSGSTIERCLFKNTGVGASSRGANVVLNNNEFNDTQGKVELVRVEEFSSNFTITNNTFNCNNAQSGIITFDRELQVVSNIEIKNNTILGFYRYFISAYAPSDLTIENNDFTNAHTTTGSAWINLTYYENASEEPIAPRSNPDMPGDFASDNIIIRNNTGLDSSNKGTLTVNVLNNAQGNVFDFPANRTTINSIDAPKQLLENGVYEIINLKTTKKLTPNTGDNFLITDSKLTDVTKWTVTFVPPYSYTIQNVETNEYLELDIPFTESNIIGNPNNLPQLFPFAKNTYAGVVADKVNRLPFWAFRKEGDKYVILPGGNELMSAIAITDSDVVSLVAARQKAPNSDARIPVELKDNAKWSFKPITDNYISWDSSSNIEFNIGETIEQKLSYEIRKSNEVLQSVDFGLVIIDEETNAFIEETALLNPTVGNSSGSITFDYTVPSDVKPSSSLAHGQTYAIRARLITKLNNTGADIIESIQVPVSIFKNITETEITWDSNTNTEFVIGSTTEQTISHAVLASETPVYSQFGLFIVNTSDNSIVSAITPQNFPSTAANIEQRETKTFNFSIPGDVVPSDKLPAGQRYVVRAIIASKDANDVDKYASDLAVVTVVAPNTVTWDTSSFTQFEVDETREQSISYFYHATETLNFIQFGLIVRNATNNSFIREIAPQTIVPVASGVNSGTKTFDFKTPTGIALSSALAANEKYSIRVRMNTTDGGGNEKFTVSFVDATVVAVNSNFVRWETFANKLGVDVETTQEISYRIQDDESIESVQFGLVITTNDNIYLSEPTPTLVGGNTAPNEAFNTEFVYEIPSETTISSDLPANQKYRLRTRVTYKDNTNTTQKLLQFKDVLVVSKDEFLSTPIFSVNQGLSVYVDPTFGALHIKNTKATVFEIYNITGQLVKKARDTKSINVESLKPGIYFLKTNQREVVKFIK